MIAARCFPKPATKGRLSSSPFFANSVLIKLFLPPLSIQFFWKINVVAPSRGTWLTTHHLVTEKERDEKKPVPSRIRTHDLLISRLGLYRCTTTTATLSSSLNPHFQIRPGAVLPEGHSRLQHRDDRNLFRNDPEERN